MRIRLCIGCVLTSCVAFLAVANLLAAGDAPVSKALETALLAKRLDWQGVLKNCGPIDVKKTIPVARAIAGHACLATNQNDESLRLFVSLANAHDRKAWLDGATAFRTRVYENEMATTANKALAKYFEGDAQARSGAWDEAAKCHREAVGLDEKSALAWNALGVACIYKKEANLAEARACFEKACQAEGNLADAHANLGTHCLITGAAETAIKEFDEALRCSKNKFSLARIGRACATLGGKRDPQSLQRVRNDFQLAEKCESVRPLLDENLGRLIQKTTEGGGGASGTNSATPTGFNARVEARRVFNAVDAAPAPQRSRVLNEQMNRYAPAERRAIVDQAGHNERGSRFWSGVPALDVRRSGRTAVEVGAAAPVGPGVAGGRIRAESGGNMATTIDNRAGSRRDAQIWGAINSSQRGDPTGGATTAGLDLAKAVGDLGPWPTKSNWFGLAPQTPLPTVKDY